MEENIVLTLNDKKRYVIVARTVYDSKEYLYLVDINNNKNFMFCELEGAKLTKVQDTELLSKLVIELSQKNN